MTKRSKAEQDAYKKGRADSAEGKYDNPSNPSGFGILKSNDRGVYEAYREGHADKEQEKKRKG